MRKLVVRVTALNAAPRGGGDTAKLMAWVVEGCLQAGAHASWTDLAGVDVRRCLGCLSCLRVGACPQHDHVPAIAKRLLDANAIIVGSPACEGGVAPQLKTLMNRLAFQALYTGAFDDKHVIGIATGGVASPTAVAKEAARIFGRRFAVLTATTATASGEHVPVDEAHQPRLAARARKLGRRLVARIGRPGRLRLSSVWYAWLKSLRRMSVRRQLVRNPYTLRAVIAAWREKGWLR